VIVTTQSVNGKMEPTLETIILGRSVYRPAMSDPALANALNSLSTDSAAVSFPVVLGKTLSCNCFYEGQGRVDGAICDYTVEDKFDFLHKAFDAGVRNIEMESLQFAAFTHHLSIPAVTICVALINRMGKRCVRRCRSSAIRVSVCV
jgi:uridine phosphorylase